MVTNGCLRSTARTKHRSPTHMVMLPPKARPRTGRSPLRLALALQMFVIGAAVAALLGVAMARNLRLGDDEQLRSSAPHLKYSGQSYLQPLYTEPPGYRAARREAARLARSAPAAEVLADDRHDDQAEGAQPEKVDARLAFAGPAEDHGEHLTDGQQSEGRGEGDEQ